MKFAFIAVAAVVVFGSSRVDGDQADIYTGLQDDSFLSKQDDDYSPLFPESSYKLPRMRASFPWTRERKPTKAASQSGSDQVILRELEEMLERRRQQIKVDAVKNFQYSGPHQQILDDPRPYAIDDQYGDEDLQELGGDDGDFSFPADDAVLDNSDGGLSPSEQIYLNRSPYSRLIPWDTLQPAPVQYNQEYGFSHESHGSPGREQTSHEEHATHKMAQEDAMPAVPAAGSGVFKDIEFVKDPADFGYPPTDPRYFEDKTRHETIEETLSKMENVNVKTLTGKMGKPNKNIYGSLNRVESAPVASYTNADPEIYPANLEHASDDYGFLTDDDDQTRREQKQEQDQEQLEFMHALLNMDINVKHRNDLGSGRQNGKDYLRNDQDVEVIAVRTPNDEGDSTGIYILAIIAGVSAAALVTLITLVITWFNLQKHVKNASDAEYPAYGVTGPNKEVSPSGDRRLAQSAQMYHYQHQKQQIIAMERAAATERHGSISEADSDEENEEGDYTVYECPGLAPTGEMEVKNPMFQDDPTPAQTPQQKQTDASSAKK